MLRSWSSHTICLLFHLAQIWETLGQKVAHSSSSRILMPFGLIFWPQNDKMCYTLLCIKCQSSSLRTQHMFTRIYHFRITGLPALVLWPNLPLLFPLRVKTKHMGMVSAAPVSSALQLTDTNSSVLISCEISSESFALSLGGAVFSGLCS